MKLAYSLEIKIYIEENKIKLSYTSFHRNLLLFVSNILLVLYNQITLNYKMFFT